MKIILEDAELRPLIERVVTETLTTLLESGVVNDKRLAYSEPEAAALLGIKRHVLRDSRLRGEIHAALCGKRYLYSRSELVRFLQR